MSLRNARGFSLIELMVVVLVAGLILAITTPSINRYLMGARLRDAASRVAGEMRLARQKSVTNNSRNRFWVASGFNYYYLGEDRWRGVPGSPYAPTQWKGPFYLPSTVRLIGPSGLPSVGRLRPRLVRPLPQVNVASTEPWPPCGAGGISPASNTAARWRSTASE